MDYLMLNSELESRTEQTKKEIALYDKISTVMKTMSKYGDNYCVKCSYALEEFTAEVNKEKLTTTTYTFYKEFTNLLEIHLAHMQSLFNLIDKEIIEKFTQFSFDQTKKDAKILDDFAILIENVNNTKSLVEKQKHYYFDSWKWVVDQEEKIKKAKESGKLKEEEIKKLENTLEKYKKNAEKECNSYKEEINKMNEFLQNAENTYKDIATSFQKEEEEKLNFNQLQFKRYHEITVASYQEDVDFSAKLINALNKINIKRDLKVIGYQFDYLTEKKKRFTKEEFLNYEYLVSNNNSNIQNADNNDNQSNEFQMSQIEDIKNTFDENNLFIYNVDINRAQNEEESNIKGTKKFSSFADKLINSETQITNDELNDIMILLMQKNDKDIPKQIIVSFYNFYKKKQIVKFKNLENMHHLSNILIVIINNSMNNNDLFYLNFLILYIAEKSIYIYPNNTQNKLYLCKLISKNKLFMDKAFWMKMIDIRIAAVVDKVVNIEIEKRESVNKSDSKSIILNVKSLFSFKEKENKKIGKEILYKQLSKEKLLSVTVGVIEDYIQHFSNFNQEIAESIDIVQKLSLKYKFDNKYVDYFNAMIKSNVFTVKNTKIILRGIEKQESIKPAYFNENFFDYHNRNIILIGNSLKYLLPSELNCIFALNKEFKNKFSKIIYKNILRKYDDISKETRLKIWKILLNFHENKKIYNYKQILQEHDKYAVKQERDIIELDAIRTSFEVNNEQNREKILRILKATRYKNTTILYCQGMNYIAAFLLTMVDYDEEEAFYLYFSLLLSTDYGNLFKDGLILLKKNFYIFDRLLNIFMPELFFFIKNNNITVNYFVSPWLITLYTNALQFITNKKNPKVIIRIWDLFLFAGWRSMIKVGLALVKCFEDKLLSFSFDEFLHFIINDIIKSDFFQNENFDTSLFSTIEKDTEEKLFSNIEEEYEIKRKLESEKIK